MSVKRFKPVLEFNDQRYSAVMQEDENGEYVKVGEILDEPDEQGLYWLEDDDTPRWVSKAYSLVSKAYTGTWVWWSPGVQDYLPVTGRVAKVDLNPFLKGG